jgi:hypothetical protein
MAKTPIQVVDTTNSTPNTTPQDAPISIEKPAAGGLDRFKSKRAPTIAGVETLLTALPHYKISDADDFVRLHRNDDYWSPEYCFVNVPIIGQKDKLLHLIDEELAMEHLSSKKIQRFRLALAAKPYDNFFLCHIPSTNLDNPWNESALKACLLAKTHWLQAESRKAEGIDGYKISYARKNDAFPEPNWPKRTLDDLVMVTFNGRTIDHHDHSALLRLIGDKQNLT